VDLGWTAVRNLFLGQCAKFCDEYLHAFMLSFSHSGIFVSPFQDSKLYIASPRASPTLAGRLALGWYVSPLQGICSSASADVVNGASRMEFKF